MINPVIAAPTDEINTAAADTSLIYLTRLLFLGITSSIIISIAELNNSAIHTSEITIKSATHSTFDMERKTAIMTANTVR